MGTTDISKLVTDWVSDVLGPDIDVAYGCFTRRAGACMVKASPGEPWVRRYLSGGGVRRFGYEVYLRVMPRGDEGPRIDALARLRLLQRAVESGECPDGVPVRSHEVTSLPAQYATEQDGAVVYQMQATITYMA